MQRRVVIGGDEREADLGQHPLHHPAEGGIFVAHVGHDTVALEIVVLDVVVRPARDVALAPVGHTDKDDVAQVEIRAGLQRGEDARHRHRLPEIRQMVQRELADDKIVGIGLVSEAQEPRRVGPDPRFAVARIDFGEGQHGARNVDGVDLGAHQRGFGRHHAIAAADVGDPPARLDAEHGQRPTRAQVAIVLLAIDRGDRGL